MMGKNIYNYRFIGRFKLKQIADFKYSHKIIQHASIKKHTRLWLKIILLSVLAIFLFTSTGLALVYRDLNSQIKVVALPSSVKKKNPTDNYNGKSINILVIGSDSRHGKGNQGYGADAGQRSDTTFVVHISKNRERVEIVSIPRDTLVTIPRCERKNGTTYYGAQNQQFNWAFAMGGGDINDAEGGLSCTWKTVELMSGLTIDEAMVVDFNGFKSMINALGGLDVYIDKPINDPHGAGLIIKETGCRHFNGEEALSLARVRSGVEGGDGSDLQRITRQQRIMGIMLRTALKKNLITDLPSLYNFMKNGLSSLTTTPALASSSTVAGLTWSLRQLQPENVIFIKLPVVPAPSNPNRVVENRRLTPGLWEALRQDTLLPPGIEVKNANNEEFTTVAIDEKNTNSQQNSTEKQNNGKSNKTDSKDNKKKETPKPTQNLKPKQDKIDESLEEKIKKCEP